MRHSHPYLVWWLRRWGNMAEWWCKRVGSSAQEKQTCFFFSLFKASDPESERKLILTGCFSDQGNVCLDVYKMCRDHSQSYGWGPLKTKQRKNHQQINGLQLAVQQCTYLYQTFRYSGLNSVCTCIDQYALLFYQLLAMCSAANFYCK